MKRTLTYYLLSECHEGLVLKETDEPLLVVYCPNWKDKGPAIVGCFHIQQISHSPFSAVLDRPLPEDSALTKEDLRYYGTYSEHERIALVKCDQLLLFRDPIPLVNGFWISRPQIGKYLQNELIENGTNAAYLDKRSTRTLCSHLYQFGEVYKPADPSRSIKKRKFKVAISFQDKATPFVEKVVAILIAELGSENVFYYRNYESELMGFDLDLLLSGIYGKQSETIVAFFSKGYSKSKWCHLEWRVMRDILFKRSNRKALLPFKLDKVTIPGILGIDNVPQVGPRTAKDIADLILKRVRR